MTTIPAYVRTSRMAIIAANELCRALYGGALDEDRLLLKAEDQLQLLAAWAATQRTPAQPAPTND
jgi:hypothetical protein